MADNGPGNSLRTYRRRFDELTGVFYAGTAAAGSTATILECTAWPIKSTIEQDDLFEDMYLMRPDAADAGDVVRRIKEYDPAAGYLYPDKEYANKPVGGEVFEISSLIEPKTDLTDIVNDALRRCFLVVELTVTPVADRQRFDVTEGNAWLSDQRWVRQVGYLASGENREEVDPFSTSRTVRGEAEKVGSRVYVNHRGRAFAEDQTIYVKAVKPAYYHCRAGSSANFGTQSGLNLDTDECPAEVDWVAAAAIVETWKRLGSLIDGKSDARLMRDRQEAAAWLWTKDRENVVIPKLTLTPTRPWGPRRGR